MRRRVNRRSAQIAGGAAAFVGAWLGVRAGLWAAARGIRTARFWIRVATLTLYRPCADCHQWIHADARVCHRCGYRKPPRTRRERRAVARAAAIEAPVSP